MKPCLVRVKTPWLIYNKGKVPDPYLEKDGMYCTEVFTLYSMCAGVCTYMYL